MPPRGRSSPLLGVLLLTYLCLPAAAFAHTLVAGWDFSQYALDGALSIDGETLTDVLDANYSDYDPTFGAGAESAAYGRMFLDGEFGSTATPLDLDNDPIVPSAVAPGSLQSNLSTPLNGVPDPDVPFDSCPVLMNEGQLYCNQLTMLGLHGGAVVFRAT